MGAFDNPRKLTDAFPHGTQFVWYGGEYQGSVQTDYGENQKAVMLVAPCDNVGDKQEYVVWGVMADQVRRMEDSDLPSVCVIGKDKRANVIQQVNKGVATDDDIPF